MSTLIHDCPHCHAAKMSFVVFGARPAPTSGGQVLNAPRALVAGECQACRNPVSAVLSYKSQVANGSWPQVVAKLVTEHHALPGGVWELKAFFPEKASPQIPEYLPTIVEKAFVQGEKNLSMEGCEEAAATMFRRALDVAIKERFPDLKGDLYKKIDRLAETNVIPDSLAVWAHMVRVIGNDGAHDLDGCSREDALSARDFVDAVLRYIFSLPGLIAARSPTAVPPLEA